MSGREIAVFAIETAVIVVGVVLIVLLNGSPGFRIFGIGTATAQEDRVAALILSDFVERLNLSVDAPWVRGETCIAIRRQGPVYADLSPELIGQMNAHLSPRMRELSTLVPVSDCSGTVDKYYGVPLGTMMISVPGAGTFCGEDWEFGDASHSAPSAICFKVVGTRIEQTQVINGR